MKRGEVTGLILAGGLGRRMGGLDKGLQRLRGRAMIEWVIERLGPQVGALLVNANQNLDAYRAFGFPVISDEIGGRAGPLAGLHAGLRRCETDWLATSPCDSPFLPEDLVERLGAGAAGARAQLAVARTGSRTHPVFVLCRRDVLASLERYLGEGGRKIDAWYAGLRVAEVAFDDEAAAFANINTHDELLAADAPGVREAGT
ncbi:MAG: molybdenum cofactor guanylyltransferase MobA [Rhodocyclaceae bacterium]